MPGPAATVSGDALALLRENRVKLLTDEEMGGILAKRYPDSSTDYVRMMSGYYRKQYNRGLLPTMTAPPKVKIGRVVITKEGPKNVRVMLPAGQRGALQFVAPLFLDGAAERKRRLAARAKKLEKRINRESRRKPDGKLMRRGRRHKRKNYWVGSTGDVVRRILGPPGYVLYPGLS